LWQNPNLQANCFLLAEIASWIKAADSTWAGWAWLSRHTPLDESAEPSPPLELGQRALGPVHGGNPRPAAPLRPGVGPLRRGYYAPEIRAASLLLNARQKIADAVSPAAR